MTDKQIFATIFTITVLTMIPTIIILAAGSERGGFLHGKWLKRNYKPSHECSKPFYSDAVPGDQWQCRKCKYIWTRDKSILNGDGGWV